MCGSPQGSILAPLLFLMYVSDLPMEVKCNLFFYADATCLILQSKNIKDIEKQQNEEFANIFDWFVDNEVFTSVKIRRNPSFLLSKHPIKKHQELDICITISKIKQHSRVTDLGCILEESVSGESMVHKIISKTNANLKFLH